MTEKIDADISRVVELLEPADEDEARRLAATLQHRRNVAEMRRKGVIPGTLPRTLRKNVVFSSTSGYGGFDPRGGGEPTDSVDDAMIVTSLLDRRSATTLHAPVLDIDFPARLVSSTKPDHWHLYLDKPMPWRNYEKLLRCLADVGIIEQGYAKASIARGFSAVRVPWLKKTSKAGGSAGGVLPF